MIENEATQTVLEREHEGNAELPELQNVRVDADSADPRRLLREAAWRQMFGQATTLNPFTPAD